MSDIRIGDEVYIHGFVDEVRKDVVIIKNADEIIPSAQETHEERAETHACDLIDRQAATDALDRIGSLDTEADKKYARSVFEALPSVQPQQIVRCKDCRWHNGEINQCNAQVCASMYGEDFCSKGERREG